MRNLNLHAGGSEVPRYALDLVHTPPANGMWHPIGHAAFVEEVYTALNTAKLGVVNEVHALARGDAHYFGIMELRAPKLDADYTTVVGLRNSHNKDFSAQLVIGSGVFVCSNLAFSGEIKVGRKHTTFIQRDLAGLVLAGIQRIPLMQRHQDMRIERYKDTTIDDADVDHLIMEMFRQDVIPPSRIRPVWDEWDNPSHEEFGDAGKTAWRLFNATTEALKGGLARLPKATQTLHEIIDSVCEVELPQAA